MNTSKTLIFFGTDDFSAPSLRKLIGMGYDIRAIVTKPDKKSGRGLKINEPLVKKIGREFDIPVWQPINVLELKDNIKAMGEVAGVLVSYGKIIPQTIIDLFTPGIINIHPSVLPKYRGPSPIESAILNGDTEIGISIMKLSSKMDAGPVYSLSSIELSGKETQPSLHEYVAEISTHELARVLPLILDGSLQPIEQDEEQASYTHLLTKNDSLLDPKLLTAEQAERKIRAHLTFPKTKIDIQDNTIIITDAHIVEFAKSPLDIRCADGLCLRIDELIAPSGRKMDASSFLNGYSAA